MFRVTRKRPNPRRWLIRGVVAVVLIGLAVWSVQSIVLPRLIRGKVEAALRELGVESPAFELRDAGLWGTELRNVSEGTGAGSALRVGAVSIVYGPVDATSGKIESITLRGAELFATVRGGKIDLGPFTRKPASPDTGKPLDLPFTRLRLESSTLHLDWEGQEIWLPVSGVVHNAGGGRLTLDARTFGAGSPISIVATLDSATGETAADLAAGDVNLASLLAAAPPTLLPDGTRAGGRAAVHVVYRDLRGRRTLAARVEPHDAWVEATVGGTRVDAERVTLRGEATLDVATLRPTALALVGDVGRLTAGPGRAVRDLHVDLQPHADALAFTVTAAGDGWRLARLEGELRGLIDAPAAPAATPPAAGPASAPVDRPLDVTAGYQLTGTLPEAVRAALAARGVDAARIGGVEVEGEAGGFVHTAARAGRDRWRFETDTTEVSLAPGDLTIGGSDGGATVRALAASLKLHATAGPREAVVRLLDDSWIDWQAVVGNDPERPLVGGDVRLGVLPGEGTAPALRVRFTDAGPDADASLRLRTDAPVSLAAAAADVRVDRVEWAAKARVPAAGSFSLDGTLAVAGGSVAHEASKTRIGRIDAVVPVTVNWDVAEPGTLVIDDLQLAGVPHPQLTGSLALAGTRATFGLGWSPLPGATLKVQGAVELAETGVVGDANLTLEPFELSDGAALASVLPAAAGWDVTGTIGASGHVAWRDGRLAPRVAVSLDGVSAKDAARGLSVEGLGGDVALESLAPLTTGGAQRLTAAKFTSGKLALTDGAVEFRVEGPRSILIEQTNWGWAGGRVYSHAFRIDPQKPDVDVVLYADGLRVSDLLALVAEDRATGEGTLFGRVPLLVRWPRVSFGDGFLYTRPGATGDLKFLDGATASTLLDQADPRFKGEGNFALVKQRVLDALRDFEYDRLRVDLENDPTKPGGELVARVNVHGKGRAGPKPQELDLTLNFRGVDEPLNAYVGFQEWLSSFGGDKQKP